MSVRNQTLDKMCVACCITLRALNSGKGSVYFVNIYQISVQVNIYNYFNSFYYYQVLMFNIY